MALDATNIFLLILMGLIFVAFLIYFRRTKP